jgi:hypothetical protein
MSTHTQAKQWQQTLAVPEFILQRHDKQSTGTKFANDQRGSPGITGDHEKDMQAA